MRHGDRHRGQRVIWAPRRLLSKLIDRLLEVSRRRQPPAPGLAANGPGAAGAGTDSSGASNRKSPEQLGIEERTVKAHVGRLMRKTGRREPDRAIDARAEP